MNTRTFAAVIAVSIAAVALSMQPSTADKTGPGRTSATTVHTITGAWSWDEDGGAFTASQDDGSATKVQGLPIVNSDGSPVVVNVCPTGQAVADVVLIRKITHSLDPIAGTGSPITGPYVIRTPVMKDVRTKVWGEEVQSLIPVSCPASAAVKPRVNKPVPLPRPRA